jgi:uncharacterized phiE125 gp8 family phage protein
MKSNEPWATCWSSAASLGFQHHGEVMSVSSVLHRSDVVSVEPTAEPVSISEARLHCDLDDNYYDSQLEQLIKVARLRVEHESRRALITQTRVANYRNFPADAVLALGHPPLQSVTSVAYVDTASVSQTLAAADYTVDTSHTPGLVVLDYGIYWPSVRGYHNDVTVTYTAGYGGAADVPVIAKHAILLMVRHLFDHAGPVVTGKITAKVPLTFDALVSQLRWGDYP